MTRPILTLALIPLLTLCAPPRAEAQVTSYALVASDTQSALDIIDTASWSASGAPIAGAGPAWGVAATPDGRAVFVADGTVGVVREIDLASRQIRAVITLSPGLRGIALTPDGRRLLVVNTLLNQVDQIDVSTRAIVGPPIPVMARPLDIAVSPSGTLAYVACVDAGVVQAIDLATGTIVATMPAGSSPTAVVFTPDGTKAYAADGAGGHLFAIDTATHAVTASIPIALDTASLAMAPDGRRVYVALFSAAKVRAFDVATDALVVEFTTPGNPRGLRVTPDGAQLIVASAGTSQLTTYPVRSGGAASSLPVGASPSAFGDFITPSLIVSTGGPLTIANDAALYARGFRGFVPFDGGTVQAGANWVSPRALSLLAGGGTIDTASFDMELSGGSVGEGVLTKTGTGRLTLSGDYRHAGGTRVQQGNLALLGTHTGPITVDAGVFRSGGTVGAIAVAGGELQPGLGGVDGDLDASQVTLTAASTLGIWLQRSPLPFECAQLRASGNVSLGGARAAFYSVYTIERPLPGTTCTIVTNATGQFAGLPEGATFETNRMLFRISYVGGDGNDVVLTALPNLPPAITGLPTARTIQEDGLLGPLPFTLSDDGVAPEALFLLATSSNQALVPDSGIVLGGAGAARTLSVTPLPGQYGQTTITLRVGDLTHIVDATLVLTVQPHPRVTAYLSEGATGAFFDTDILLANPHTSVEPVTLRFTTEDNVVLTRALVLPPMSRQTVHVDALPGLEATTFSTELIARPDRPIVVERTMWWDATGYGAHTERATSGPALQWHFAEGAQGFFATYFLLSNPTSTPNVAHIVYYREDGTSITRDYPMPHAGRLSVDAGEVAELATQSFGTVITFDRPGVAERAMYFGAQPAFSGGAASAGVTAPSETWYLAEGATGSFFSTFVLVANPNMAPTDVTLTYLRPNGGVIATRTRTLLGRQRLTVDVAGESDELAAATFATVVTSPLPVVVERSLYWPKPHWYESHNNAGVTAPARTWGLAEGQVGGPHQAQTFILLGNPGSEDAEVTITFLPYAIGSGSATFDKTFTVAAQSRLTVAIAGDGSDVPELRDEPFGARIASTQPIVVERSLYGNAGGVLWAAGTSATGTPLPDPPPQP